MKDNRRELLHSWKGRRIRRLLLHRRESADAFPRTSSTTLSLAFCEYSAAGKTAQSGAALFTSSSRVAARTPAEKWRRFDCGPSAICVTEKIQNPKPENKKNGELSRPGFPVARDQNMRTCFYDFIFCVRNAMWK